MQERREHQEQALRPYGAMVMSLFKLKDYQLSAEPLVHAAIGILGELMELASATDPDNFVEECGDAEFYLEAFLQQLETSGISLLVRTDMNIAIADELRDWNRTFTGHDLIIHCTLPAVDLLDLTKKIWVYSQPLSLHITKLAQLLGVIHGRLRVLYAERSIDRFDVLRANQRKLAKRYPEGVYSNADAAARADKVDDSTQETEGAASA